MRLIDTNEFLRREWMMRAGMQVERRTKVLDFRDDETTDYAILSHRWIDDTEINYEEMDGLANMEEGERDAIRERLGYTKILDTCRQAQKDGYKWVWVDTCCIDKRSSAELSEAINSMYRWYRNAKTCYAYLHDVDFSFPTKKDNERYPTSNGWPEWFSRGWTLQEMIAPSDVQFFNQHWQPIGNKVMHARTLKKITRVPEDILTDGLDKDRLCVAQIISWAADRTTTRVEDRAYSLMGLLDVNMPMLYGEGKKAFHRLQLEIIRSSNDQSIFMWGWNSHRVQIGSVLADDPSFFKDCSNIVLTNHDWFIERSKEKFPELCSMDADHFGVFPVTNRGIQIRMLLCPYRESKSVFRAYLSCRCRGVFFPCHIDLVLWNSNYYRYPNVKGADLGDSSEFRQVYLRYQDTPNHAVTFEVDDSGLIENGFTCPEHKRNIFTLTNVNPFYLRTYSNGQGNCRFKVVFGQYLDQHWVHLEDLPFGTTAQIDLEASIARGPDWASSISTVPFLRLPRELFGQLWIRHFHLPGSPWVVRAYRVMWERSKIEVRIEVFSDPHFPNGPDVEWKACTVEVSDFLVHVDHYHHHSQRGSGLIQDPRGLMLPNWKTNKHLLVNGHRMGFSFAGEGIKVRMYAPYILLGLTVQQLGDYGYFTDSGQFCVQGNLLSDFKSRISEADITPRQKEVTSWKHNPVVVDNTGMSLPNNPAFNSLLAPLTPQHINAYLVTHVVRYRQGESRSAPNLVFKT